MPGADDATMPFSQAFERLVRFGQGALRLPRADAEDCAQEALSHYCMRLSREERAALVFTESTVRLLVGYVWRIQYAVFRRERRRGEDLRATLDDLALTTASNQFEALDTKRCLEALRTRLEGFPSHVVELLLQAVELVDRPDAMSDRERHTVARARRKLARPWHSSPHRARRQPARRPTRR